MVLRPVNWCSRLLKMTRGVTHPVALCAAYRSVAQSAKETGYTAERCNQRGVAETMTKAIFLRFSQS